MRGTLCPALKALFEHGLKKPSLLGGACHPWLFIEEVITAGPCAFSMPALQVPVVLTQSFPGFVDQRSVSQRAPGLLQLVHAFVFYLEACRAVACAHLSLSSPSPSCLPQAAGREVERDFDSVYSRLVLCKTYRYIQYRLCYLPVPSMAASEGNPVLAGWMKMAKS